MILTNREILISNLIEFAEDDWNAFTDYLYSIGFMDSEVGEMSDEMRKLKEEVYK